MKKLFFILLAALLLSVQGFSQSAREILEKVFENMEKNYDLSESYRQYDIKGLLYSEDSLVGAVDHLIVVKTPKNPRKDVKRVSSYLRSYRRGLGFEINWVEVNYALVLYKDYLKSKRGFFKDFTEISVSPPLEGYVLKFKKGNEFAIVYVTVPDYAITKYDVEYSESNPDADPHMLAPVKTKKLKGRVYGECEKVGDKYETVYFMAEEVKNDVAIFGLEYHETMRMFVNYVTKSDKMILQKNAKGRMTYEEALRLAKSM